MGLKGAYDTVKSAVMAFADDDAMTMGAALAFYTALSLAPLLMIFISIAGLMGPNAQQHLIQQVQSMVGTQARDAITEIVKHASQRKTAGTVAAILGIVTLLFSAAGVFSQLQSSLNKIWKVEPKPGEGFWNWLRKRFLSLGMVVGIGFLLIVSMIISAAITLVFGHFGHGTIWQVINFAVSLVIFILLFAMVFKVLPDVEIPWRNVWVGSLITAILFDIGKYLIGKYLGYSSVGSAYGAAGSLVVLLAWVYYASLIVFLGAEMTHVYASRHGPPAEPEEHARWAGKDKGKAPESRERK